ncbi:MAG TPA: GNAT family N-acetyltransferase [Acidimicrobiales bacterium]|nr:GNAT family N-acetyltransferase [Acidimicrobiales bacterium]
MLAAAARDAVAAQRGGPLLLARELRELNPFSLDDPERLVVVGTVDEVPMGYAAVVVEELGERRLAVIEALFVEPEAREVGVGEAMMDLVLHWAAGHGVIGLDAVALPGDRATKNFFERFGLTARAIVVHRALNDE